MTVVVRYNTQDGSPALVFVEDLPFQTQVSVIPKWKLKFYSSSAYDTNLQRQGTLILY